MKPALIFMGTPEFAVPCLQSLLDAGYPVKMVVTQPDKPVGRKQVLTAPPVKVLAQAHGIEVYQPSKLRNVPEVLEKLKAVGADLFVVVAYGKILPQEVLDLPSQGCINVHASLLPKYRGSAPIQWCLVNGESETGVTTMLMDAGMDTGDMLLKRTLSIAADETGISLTEKLSKLGSELLIETLPGYLKGDILPQIQDASQATQIPLLKKEHGLLHWQEPAQALYHRIQGLKPWPETYTFFRGKPLKIKEAQVYAGEWHDSETRLPGHVAKILKQSILVQTGVGLLELLRVHPADSKEMAAGDFARGQRVEVGELFGAENPGG
ncbi:MAG: methionyl-tRNA formyltransferase [Candidatus Sericytochromatia bacterium]